MSAAPAKYKQTLGVILVAWLLVALLSYGQNYLFFLIREEIFYPAELLSFALIGLSWIPFTYPVMWISWRLPLSKGQLPQVIGFHLLTTALIIAAHLTFNAWLMSAFWKSFIYPVNFQEMFLKLLTFSGFTDIIVYALLVAVVHGIKAKKYPPPKRRNKIYHFKR